MRQSRLIAPPNQEVAYYHCVSRVVNRDFVLMDDEKDEFVRLLRLYENFCGLRVVTFCVMADHFHLLVEVPKPPEEPPADEEVLARLKRLNSPEVMEQIRYKYESLQRSGDAAAMQTYRESFTRRMWNVSFFMKGFKQRFGSWYNRTHGRRGTLWEERFKSVLVEPGEALLLMACYIDLNPVRALLVRDPQNYRWCGYSTAMAGERRARAGIRVAIAGAGDGERSEKESLARYGELLLGTKEERSAASGGSVSRERIEQARAGESRLTRWELLRCRVRYFSDGMVFGSKEFVDSVFQQERSRFGPKRKSGARPLRHLEAGGLATMRDLRLDPFG